MEQGDKYNIGEQQTYENSFDFGEQDLIKFSSGEHGNS